MTMLISTEAEAYGSLISFTDICQAKVLDSKNKFSANDRCSPPERDTDVCKQDS